MGNNSEKFVYKSIAFNGCRRKVATNTPTQYNDRQHQYMASRTEKFYAERAYLATDYVIADVQGLGADFYEWRESKVRLADIATLSASSTRKADDFKLLYFTELGIDYIPIGAKIKAMGSVWLVVNPQNMSTSITNTVVARCNATYNSYDQYGNVIVEPIVVEKYTMLGNDNETPNNMVLMDGYYNITCQLNDNTKQLKQNTRIILGTKAYHITGLTDFIQEFTGDRENIHLITFTARVEEPDKNDDISVNFIAGGLRHNFGVEITGGKEVGTGKTTLLTAHFIDNGVEVADVEPQWQWESSNTSVATVDSNGLVTAVGVGETTIKAVLSQNESLFAVASLVVEQTADEPYIEFVGAIPSALEQFESVVLDVDYFDNGQYEQTGYALTETADGQIFAGADGKLFLSKYGTNLVSWSFGGADKFCYSVEYSIDGNEITVTCLRPSAVPLIVTATCGTASKTIEIELIGY